MISVTVRAYQFDELSDASKARAREDNRAAGLEHGWWDDVYDDFTDICVILGITLQTRPHITRDGTLLSKPCIWFSGFSQQGDGACFEGTYTGSIAATEAIRQHAPQDTRLHDIAAALNVDFYEPYNGTARVLIQHDACPYVHKYTMNFGQAYYYDNDGRQEVSEARLGFFRDQMWLLADWLYIQLLREHDYQLSDAVIDEAFRSSGVWFLADGSMFDPDCSVVVSDDDSDA